MADGSADFTLRLRNEVTGPARKMSASIRGLSSDFRDKQRFFAKGETEFQKKLKASRRLADRAHRQEMRPKLRAVEFAKGQAQRRSVGFQRGVVRQREAERTARHQAMRDEGLEPGMGVGSKAGLIAVAGVLATAAAAVGFLAAKFTSATIAAVDFAQRSKTALTSILKDGALATQQFREVRMEAGGLGLDVTDTVDQFKMLANSGFKIPMARDLVRMSADLQALTGSSESAQFALRAISQIKMKGRLQAEEITGQLAEHGVSADEVYRVLGKTLGKTRQEILAMQKAGDLSADVAIPAILQAVRNQLGVEKSGGFAMKINASSVGGMWRTLKGQVQNAFVSLGEQVGPGITRAFSSIMASIQTAIAGPKMQKLGTAVVGIFDAVSSLVGQTDFATLLTEGASGLGRELTLAATFIRDHGAELRESFMTFVRFMGTTMTMAIDFMRPFVAFMNSGFGKFLVQSQDKNTSDVLGSLADKGFGGGFAPEKARGGGIGAGAAAAAGAAMGNKIEMKFGDIHVSLDSKTPGAAAGELTSEVRKQFLAMMQDL